MADFEYCNQKCSVGKAASKKCLDESESVFDAVLDFKIFVDKCYQTCPYKDEHKMEEDRQ
jgi:hypothetical protein